MKRFQNVAKFAETESGKKLVAMMEDYANHYLSANKMANVSYDEKYTLSEKAEKINKTFVEELARRSKYSVDDFEGNVQDYANFKVVNEMGANIQKILLDATTPIFLNASGLAMIAEFHYGGYGDVFEFEDKDNSIYTVSKMGRRQRHTKTQESKKQNKTISTDMYGLSVYTTLPQIILGESMLAEDIVKMALAMNKKIYTVTLKQFIASVETLTDTALVVTNYNEKSFLTALRNAQAKNGTNMLIVGDNVALKDVLPSDSRTRILLYDEYNTTVGYMTKFNGFDVVGFDVVADDNEADGVLGLPTNRLYALPVTGNKMIHIAIGYTATNGDDAWDNDNLVAITTFRKELGVSLATNKKPVKVEL